MSNPRRVGFPRRRCLCAEEGVPQHRVGSPRKSRRCSEEGVPRRGRLIGAAGVFLALLGLYLFTMPGRIDIVDGQWRYEVARNWLDSGEPVAADRYLLGIGGNYRNPATGKSYAVYNALPSLTPMPFMALSRLLPGHGPERDHFAFSLAGPLFGAALGALLILAYGMLGIGLGRAVLFTGIFCVATLWWPATVTTFDQNQHALLLLGAVLLAWQSGRRHSLLLAGLAGLIAGLLLNYQEIYLLVLPVVGLAVLASPEEGSSGDEVPLRQSLDRAGLRRYLMFGLGCCLGLGLFMAYNSLRLGTPLLLARYGSQIEGQPRMWGDPLAGLLSLAFSPGKGILWYSPPLLLALLGARRFWRRAPVLTLTVAGVSAMYLLVIIHLTFFGGDWCWGPRYAIPVMPLWALMLPFAVAPEGRFRRFMRPLAVAGLLIQVMAVSLDHNRFFHERNHWSFFWAKEPWVYFRQSQLAARPAELLESVTTGLPAEARRFSPAPTRQATYCPWGPRNADRARLWVRHFQIFHLPRPWWGWIGWVTPDQRPVDPGWLLAACATLLALGSGLLLSFRRAGLADTQLRRSGVQALGPEFRPPTIEHLNAQTPERPNA